MNILISGASTGIGRAAALYFSTERGARVWAGVRNPDDFRAIEDLRLPSLRPVYLDVVDPASVRRAVDTVVDDGGSLNAVINNAGIAVGGPIEGVELADWRRQFEVNLFGAVSLTRACLPSLRRSRGRVVNISSISGRVAFPYLGPYAASKFALEAFGDSLRREVRDQGIRVSAIEPGAIATPLWDKSVNEGLGRVARFDPPLREVYGPALDRFNGLLDRTIRAAAPAATVVRAVDHAVYAKRPRARYQVGRGIRTMAMLHDWLPASWWDRAF